MDHVSLLLQISLVTEKEEQSKGVEYWQGEAIKEMRYVHEAELVYHRVLRWDIQRSKIEFLSLLCGSVNFVCIVCPAATRWSQLHQDIQETRGRSSS